MIRRKLLAALAQATLGVALILGLALATGIILGAALQVQRWAEETHPSRPIDGRGPR